MKNLINLFWLILLVLVISSCNEDNDNDDDNEGGTTDDVVEFSISSIAIVDGEILDDYKCEEKVDNIENSIPLSWEGVPEEATSLAINMIHYPNPDNTEVLNSYLILWDIDPSVTSIPYATADLGPWFMGSNKDGNAISYSSPCSRGGGTQEYTITIYALSETPPSLPSMSTIDVNYDVFIEALSSVTIIDTAEITFNAVTEGMGDDDMGMGDDSEIISYGQALIDRIEADMNPDGAGIDLTFRNSGLVIDEAENAYYAVNGVHPINMGDYTSYYPKSIVKASLDTDEIIEYWSFNAETLGHDVDMEGLTFVGEDRTTLYIGDEYNYIYEFDLTQGVVTREWDISDIAETQNGGTAIPVDKGIEAITYLDGYFYVGIQETGYIHKLDLHLDVTDTTDDDYQFAEEISGFSAGISPSGLFAAADGTLYMVAVDGTGGDQFIYNFTTDGTQNCILTIDSSISIARSDGIYIDNAEEYVYIADSQGPLFDGYSLYRIPWNPEDCQ